MDTQTHHFSTAETFRSADTLVHSGLVACLPFSLLLLNLAIGCRASSFGGSSAACNSATRILLII